MQRSSNWEQVSKWRKKKAKPTYNTQTNVKIAQVIKISEIQSNIKILTLKFKVAARKFQTEQFICAQSDNLEP